MMMRDAFSAGAFVISLLAFTLADAQQTVQKYLLETRYLIFLPDGYDREPSKEWPLMVFLHGSGESGDDLEKVKVNGPPKLIEQGKKFPFIVISPQAPDPETGFQPEVLRRLIADVRKKYRVDNDRIYLTGLSMGGFGTWDLAEKHPDEFAAIAPICSGGDAANAWKLRNVPVWCFHGAKDDAVPLSESQQMVDSLKKYQSQVRFTIYPGLGHNSWDVTYLNDSLYAWFLSHKKYKNSRITLKNALEREYMGSYIGPEKDTLHIVTEQNKLMLMVDNENKIEILPSSETSFFIMEDPRVEILFLKNESNRFKGFWVFDRLSRKKYLKIVK